METHCSQPEAYLPHQWEVHQAPCRHGFHRHRLRRWRHPPYVMENGHYEGVDSVIDKDLAAAVLGTDIGAEDMYILTDVPEVYLHFGTDRHEPIREMAVAQAATYADRGYFPAGSMGPKIEAVTRFISAGGKRIILTNIDTLELARKGVGSTIIHP